MNFTLAALTALDAELEGELEAPVEPLAEVWHPEIGWVIAPWELNRPTSGPGWELVQ